MMGDGHNARLAIMEAEYFGRGIAIVVAIGLGMAKIYGQYGSIPIPTRHRLLCFLVRKHPVDEENGILKAPRVKEGPITT